MHYHVRQTSITPKDNERAFPRLDDAMAEAEKRVTTLEEHGFWLDVSGIPTDIRRQMLRAESIPVSVRYYLEMPECYGAAVAVEIERCPEACLAGTVG